ncbi:DUF948 domain-containing protein [Oceanobacillus zhaokaii]|uniref:DUF948 domain-containing protein n=1 Tax=Oceanobacillus zhaokaii TaxID=2052660 RepID=A0A345PCC7_9BACI|nr:DUF948 domain-containing protein [Oceanobacillus zhaokaii]AXI07657.1 DUF948 domain-containing protein [Oceanobacillus zhaokaii]
MTWLGIGVLVIGIALLVLVIVLIKPLLNLAGVLTSVQKTTDQLPNTVSDLTSQTKEVMGTSVETLNQVNTQIKELSPLFYTVGNLGRATNHLTSLVVNVADETKVKTESANQLTTNKNLEGLYGVLTLGYFLFKSGKK